MRRLFALVATVVLVDTMFYAAIAPLLPAYADDLDLSKTAAGVLSAAYPAGTLIGSLPSGWLAARIGVKRTLLVGLTLLGSSSLAFAFGDSVAVLDTARFAQGLGGACAWTGGLAWLMAASSRDRRGELIGSALAAAIAGVLLGPVLGGAATVAGPEPVFGAVAIVAIVLAAWAASLPAPPPSEAPGLRHITTALVSVPVLAAVWLVALPSLFAGVLDVLAPLRLDELGASGVAIGAVFLVAAAVEAVSSRAAGALSDRRGRELPIRAGLAACGAAALLLPLPDLVVLLALAVVGAALALSLLWAPSMALLSDAAEAEGVDQAFAFALVNLAWAGGQVVGGSAGAALADAYSDAVPYAICAALFAVSFAVLAGRVRVRA
ncbi:MAG TPA: MFS transporter [Solirubrobacterales bacterium]|jgi:MFS family permease|nr:MFS transporter [Solirubrobacterales bacterium]